MGFSGGVFGFVFLGYCFPCLFFGVFLLLFDFSPPLSLFSIDLE